MDKVNSETNKFGLSDTSKYISMQSKFVAKPLGIFVLIIALFSGSIYFSLGRFNSIKAKIDDSQRIQKTLATKVGILRNVSKVLPDDISFVDLALPNKGIAIYGMSQVRNQASLLGLTISNLRIGGVVEDKDGVSRVSITFGVEGDEQSIYNYLGLFPKLLPLMKVDKVSISNFGGIFEATVTISAFSGELPTKIPSLTTPITDLTSDEAKTLNEISGYSAPQFEVPIPFSGDPKEDPFN